MSVAVIGDETNTLSAWLSFLNHSGVVNTPANVVIIYLVHSICSGGRAVNISSRYLSHVLRQSDCTKLT